MKSLCNLMSLLMHLFSPCVSVHILCIHTPVLIQCMIHFTARLSMVIMNVRYSPDSLASFPGLHAQLFSLAG